MTDLGTNTCQQRQQCGTLHLLADGPSGGEKWGGREVGGGGGERWGERGGGEVGGVHSQLKYLASDL